jgi:tryptophan halogenase
VVLGTSEELVVHYQDNGPELTWRSTLLSPPDPFGMEGYLSLLVGQQVPYANRPPIPDKDWETLRKLRAVIREQTRLGVGPVEMLRLIRSGTWDWPPNLFPRGPVPPFAPAATITTQLD